MVNIYVDNFLSTVGNRALHNALLSLSRSKICKPEDIEACENFSIAAICELIENIRNEDNDPNKFDFTAQLTFGVIQLYRFQVDKLLNQAKVALQSCEETFSEIDWLTRMSETQAITDSTQLSFILPVEQKEVSKQQSLSVEIELIEKALTIPDVAGETAPKKKGKNQKNDDIDPTMAQNAREITLVEKYTPCAIVDFRSVIEDGFEFSDFGESLENKDPTFSSDVMDIVHNTKNLGKRRLSETLDISESIERAAKAPKLSVDENHNISSFDRNAQ